MSSSALATARTVSHHTAASEAASIHMHYEGEVVETPLARFAGHDGYDGVVVLAPTQGIVEVFPGPGQAIDALVPVVEAVVRRGWAAGVVVPAERMGEAHRGLRGCRVSLQAWWPDADRICFGGPEVP
jgi:hypothetical protein